MSMREQMATIAKQIIMPLRNRVYTIISRAVLESVDDTMKMQLVKMSLLAGENRSDVERFQNYGFTSVPKPGAEAIAVSVGGNRDHLITLVVDDRRFRLKAMAEGEVAIYTDEGDKIHLKRNGIIQIVASSKVDVDANLVELGNGTLEKILNGETFRTRYNLHSHLGNLGVPTGPPTTLSPTSDLSNDVKGAK